MQAPTERPITYETRVYSSRTSFALRVHNIHFAVLKHDLRLVEQVVATALPFRRGLRLGNLHEKGRTATASRAAIGLSIRLMHSI